jgi:hypothetical protein
MPRVRANSPPAPAMGPGAATQERNDALGIGRRNAIERQRPHPRDGGTGFFFLTRSEAAFRKDQVCRFEGEARLLKLKQVGSEGIALMPLSRARPPYFEREFE